MRSILSSLAWLICIASAAQPYMDQVKRRRLELHIRRRMHWMVQDELSQGYHPYYCSNAIAFAYFEVMGFA